MKKYIMYFAVLSLVSCASIELPTVEESQTKISAFQPQLDSINQIIDSKTTILPKDSEVDFALRQEVINKIFNAVASNKDIDITINFLPTKNLIKEEKSVLGVDYTNFVNVEKGLVNMDLKKFRFISIDNNNVEALIEIEGEGKITVSGKHTGVPANVTSDINLYLNENVKFKLHYTDSGSIVLKPIPKKLKLKTKFSINLLKFNIPWREEIELEFDDILKPIAVPAALAAEIALPIPSKARKAGTFQNVMHEVIFSKVQLHADKNIIRWRSDVDFKKKETR